MPDILKRDLRFEMRKRIYRSYPASLPYDQPPPKETLTKTDFQPWYALGWTWTDDFVYKTYFAYGFMSGSMRGTWQEEKMVELFKGADFNEFVWDAGRKDECKGNKGYGVCIADNYTQEGLDSWKQEGFIERAKKVVCREDDPKWHLLW